MNPHRLLTLCCLMFTTGCELTENSVKFASDPVEICDGKDNDGDGQIDEGLTIEIATAPTHGLERRSIRNHGPVSDWWMIEYRVDCR